MKVQMKATNIEITFEDLVNLFSTALYGDHTFDVWVPDQFKNMKQHECYEENLADVLIAGGYVCVADNEAAGDTEEDCDANSTILDVEEYDTGENFLGDSYVVPVYHLTFEDIKKGLMKIAEGNVDSYLKKNFFNMFDEDGNPDFYDGWNIFQFIVFGDVIYG